MKMTLDYAALFPQYLRASVRNTFLSLHAGGAAGGEVLHLPEGRRRGVPGGGHGEGAVGRAEIDRALGIAAAEKSVDQSRGEAVAPADAVEDGEVAPLRRLIELPAVPADRPPVVEAGAPHPAQGGGDDPEIGEPGHRLRDHAFKAADVEVDQLFVDPLDLEPEGGGKILLVADHDIDIGRDGAVDRARPFDPADALPERGAVIEVVGDHRLVAPGRSHRLEDDIGGGFREGGEDAAGVEPAHPLHPEELLPVDLAGFELRGGGMAAVAAAGRPAHTKTALGKVEAVAHRAADAVVGDPLDPARINPALKDKILDQPADGIVGEGGDDGGAQAKAAAQSAGDVVLPPALPGAERARGMDALLARIEA